MFFLLFFSLILSVPEIFGGPERTSPVTAKMKAIPSPKQIAKKLQDEERKKEQEKLILQEHLQEQMNLLKQ
jgi:hypothetical protein